KVVTRDQMADQRRASRPRSHAHPSEILVRVTEMDQLPVEDRGDTRVAHQEVADTIIAVHDTDARRLGRVRLQPQHPVLEYRIAEELALVQIFLPPRDLANADLVERRVAGKLGGGRSLPCKICQRGEAGDELLAELGPDAFVEGALAAGLGPRQRSL